MGRFVLDGPWYSSDARGSGIAGVASGNPILTLHMGWRKLLKAMSKRKIASASLAVVCAGISAMSMAVVVTSAPNEVEASVAVSATQAVAGYKHGCAVMSNGTVRCWGINSDGQFGNGTTSSTSSGGVQVAGITDAVKVDVNPGNIENNNRSCALLSSGQAKCWGIATSSLKNYMGTGDSVARYLTPMNVCRSGSTSAGTCVPLENGIDISVDAFGGCVVTSTDTTSFTDNRIYCWGQIPDSTIAIPVCTSGTVAANTCVELTKVTKVASDQYHRCALTSDKKVFCWGTNESNQLGRELETTARNTASEITIGGASVTDVVDVATGGRATCIIREPSGSFTHNRIQCIGDRYYGHTGDGLASGITTDQTTWVDICGYQNTTNPTNGQPCATNVLPGSATKLVGGSSTMCAYIPSGYGTGDNGWSCWSGSGNEYLARPTDTSIAKRFIGQLCHAGTTTYSSNGECPAGKRFTGQSVDISGSTNCGVESGSVYCWGLSAGGSMLAAPTNIYGWPYLITMNPTLSMSRVVSAAEPASAFGDQPIVQLTNSNGTINQTAGVQVSASASAVSGTGSLSGTMTATTDSQGQAEFANLAVSSAGTYTLTFSATGYGSTGQTIRVATLTSRTLIIDAGSFSSSYAGNGTPPTITSTASAGSGQKTFTSSTTGVCTVGSTSGVVTFVDNGTCTIGASIASDGTYRSVSATPISFTVNEVTRSVSIDSGSYQSTYVQNQSGPTLTATRSAGSGAITYSTSSPSVCSVGVNSGTITFSSTGACVVSAAVAASGYYAAATSNTVSITVTATPSSTSTTSSSTTSTTTTAPASSRSATTTTVAGAATTTTVFGQSAVATVAPRASVTTTTAVRDNSNSDDSSSTTTSTLPPVPVATAPPEATAQQLAPIDVPTIDRGGAAVVIGGEEVPVEITRENDQVLIRAGMFDARFAGLRSDGSIIPLDSDGFIRVESGDAIRVEVMGFASSSDVEVRLYSDPMLLGEATVDADGKMLSAYEIPEGVERGAHRVVLVGKNQRDDEVTFTAGIIVGAEAGTTLTTRLLIAVPIGLAVLLGIFLPAILRRRREEEEAVA